MRKVKSHTHWSYTELVELHRMYMSGRCEINLLNETSGDRLKRYAAINIKLHAVRLELDRRARWN